MTGDIVTYGVFWRTKLDPEKWDFYSGWYSEILYAKEDAKRAAKNPRVIEVAVVERVEKLNIIERLGKEE